MPHNQAVRTLPSYSAAPNVLRFALLCVNNKQPAAGAGAGVAARFTPHVLGPMLGRLGEGMEVGSGATVPLRMEGRRMGRRVEAEEGREEGRSPLACGVELFPVGLWCICSCAGACLMPFVGSVGAQG